MKNGARCHTTTSGPSLILAPQSAIAAPASRRRESSASRSSESKADSPTLALRTRAPCLLTVSQPFIWELLDDFTLVQIRIWFCEVKKAEHLLACGWALEKPIATLRRLSLDSSQQYFLTNSAVDSSFRI